MPIEGIPTEPSTPAAAMPPAITPDAAVNNTAATTTPGAGTQPASTEAQPEPEKKFTQADVDRMIAQRLPKAVKSELKKLSSDGEGTTAEELQQQLSETSTELRGFKARDSVREYLTDARHKLNIRSENVRAIEELVIPRLTYDAKGKPENIKEAIESAQSIAPVLFANNPSGINAGNGRNSATAPTNMNDMIRQMHAGRNS